MPAAELQHEVKRIGETGQISVGKSLAGKLVRVEPGPEGVLLRFVVDVPEKDVWWLKEPHKSDLARALAWAKANPPAETDLDALRAEALARKKGQRSAVKGAKVAKRPASTRTAKVKGSKR